MAEAAVNLKREAKSGITWNAIADMFIQVLRFGGSIVLARILFPEDFGVMGVAAIFINFAKRLANFGFSASLIQRKEVDRGHIDSMFWFNFLLFGTVALGLTISAPSLKTFFNSPGLQEVLGVIALSFFIESLTGVPDALLKRSLKFRVLALSRLIRNGLNVGVAIVLAVLGFGVWSLVLGILAGNVARLVVLMIAARWFPGFRFSFSKLKSLTKFGFGVTLANYMNYFIKNVDYFLIGKFLGVAPLGYYERAFNLMNMTRRRVARNMNAVLFATYSRVQDQDTKIISGVNKVLQTVGVVSYPLHGLLFFIAPALIYNLYGAKWMPSILPLQIMCLSGVMESLIIIFTPVIMAKENVYKWTLMQLFYLGFLVATILMSLPYGINGVAVAIVISSSFYLFLTVRLVSRTISFGFRSFFLNQKDLWLYFIPAVIFTFAIDYLMRPYFGPFSITKAVLLSIAFLGTLALSHLIWRKKFVSDFWGEIVEIFEKVVLRFRKPEVREKFSETE